MNSKLTMLYQLGLAVVGSLGIGISSATAQSLYVETYEEAIPVVVPYEVVTRPRYVVRPVVVTPPPIVRERIVVRRPALVGPPIPPPYVVADW
jgi:hypothetical protein